VRRKERERLGEGEGARQQEDQPPARDERGRGEGEEVGEDRLERRGHRAGDMRGELRLWTYVVDVSWTCLEGRARRAAPPREFAV